MLMILHSMVNAQSNVDSLEIERVARNYVEGWAEGNIDRVTSAVSEELVKRIVLKDKDGYSYLSDMGASLLLMSTKSNIGGVNQAVKDFEPGKKFKAEVIIYDITGSNSTLKISNSKYGFFDYCQLSKIGGKWKVINVLWDWLPNNQLPDE